MKRRGFISLELGAVLVILAVISIGILVKMSGETQTAVVDGLKQEFSVIVTKIRGVSMARSKRFEGLDADGLKLYGDTIPYTIATNKIFSSVAGGCYWIPTPVVPYTKFDLKLDCSESGWSAGAIDGENSDVKARVVSTLRDFAVLSLKISDTSVTEDRSAGKLEITFSGII